MQRGKELGGHLRWTGVEDLKIFQIAVGVETALDHDAGAGQVLRKGDPQAARAGQRGRFVVGVGVGFGELHDHGAERGIDVIGVVVAGKLAVEIEGAAGARGGDDGDGGAVVSLDGGPSG